MTNRPVECANCDWTGPLDDAGGLPEEGIHERVMPGEIMPAGECPACGAVCHFSGHVPAEIIGEAMQGLTALMCREPDSPLDAGTDYEISDALERVARRLRAPHETDGEAFRLPLDHHNIADGLRFLADVLARPEGSSSPTDFIRARHLEALALTLQGQGMASVLTRAMRFVEGFEGDEAQEGVRELLIDLRRVAAGVKPLAPAPVPLWFLLREARDCLDSAPASDGVRDLIGRIDRALDAADRPAAQPGQLPGAFDPSLSNDALQPGGA